MNVNSPLGGVSGENPPEGEARSDSSQPQVPPPTSTHCLCQGDALEWLPRTEARQD